MKKIFLIFISLFIFNNLNAFWSYTSENMSIKSFSWISYIDFWESVDWWFDYKTWYDAIFKTSIKNENFYYNIDKWNFIKAEDKTIFYAYKPKKPELLLANKLDNLLKVNEEFKIYNNDWSLYTIFTPKEIDLEIIWENSNGNQMKLEYSFYNDDKSSLTLYFTENISWKKLYYFVKDWVKLEESEEREIFDFNYIPNSNKLIYKIKKYNWQKWCWDFIHWAWSCDSYAEYLVIDNIIFKWENYFNDYSISQDWKQIFIEYSNINMKITSWLWLILLDWNIEDTYKKVINAYISFYADEVKKIKWWNKLITQINNTISKLNREKTENLYLKLLKLKDNTKIDKKTLSVVNLMLYNLNLHLSDKKDFNLTSLEIIKKLQNQIDKIDTQLAKMKRQDYNIVSNDTIWNIIWLYEYLKDWAKKWINDEIITADYFYWTKKYSKNLSDLWLWNLSWKTIYQVEVMLYNQYLWYFKDWKLLDKKEFEKANNLTQSTFSDAKTETVIIWLYYWKLWYYIEDWKVAFDSSKVDPELQVLKYIDLK